MKFCITLATLTFAGLAFATVAATPVQDAGTNKPAPAAPAAPAMPDMSANMPNEHHQRLAEMVGHWTLNGKGTMGPGMDFPIEGTSEFTSIMGGRFLMETTKGGPTPVGPFEGMGITGYDNSTGKFEQFWFDNQRTGFTTQTGDEDPATHEITWRSQQPNMLTGKLESHRSTMQKVSDSEWKFEDFVTASGAETKAMEITYTRAR